MDFLCKMQKKEKEEEGVGGGSGEGPRPKYVHCFSLEGNLDKRSHHDSAFTPSKRDGTLVFMLQPTMEEKLKQSRLTNRTS